MSSLLAAQRPVPVGTLSKVVTGSAKVTTSIDVGALPRGEFLVGVQVTRAGTVSTACRAGIYVRVYEVLNAGSTPLRVLWAGYLRDGAAPASIPNIRARAGTSYVADIWALAEFNGETVNVQLIFDTMPAGGTYIHTEAPGEGPGQSVVVSLGDPAAGAEYATQTVPTLERWLVRSFAGACLTDATVVNRRLALAWDDGSNVYARSAANLNFTAGTTWAHSVGLDATQSSQAFSPITWAQPRVLMSAGHRLSFATGGLTAGDNWGAGYLVAEKWVMPGA